jgi:hypothetical protein
MVATDAARLPIIARMEPETHAVIGGGRQLCSDPPGGADHGLCFQVVGFQSNTLEKLDYYVEGRLLEHGVARCKVCVVDVEYREETPHQFRQVFHVMVRRAFLLESDKPLPCNGVYQYVEELCCQRPALSNTLAGLTRHAIITRCAAHHLRVLPKVGNEPSHVGACPVSLYYKQASISIHKVEGLFEIQKHTEERALLQVCQLLGQFGLDDGCPSAAAVPASM